MIVYVCSKIFVGLPFSPEKTLFRVLCQVSLRLIDGSSKKAVALRLRPSENTCQYIYCNKLYFFIKSVIQARLIISISGFLVFFRYNKKSRNSTFESV